MWWWSDYLPVHWVLGPLMMIVVISLCGAMMFFMIRGMMPDHRQQSNALDILKERFARGEITETEYEDRRRRIEA